MQTATYYHLGSGAIVGQGQVEDDWSHPELPNAEFGIYQGLADAATEYVTSPTTKAARADAVGVVVPESVEVGQTANITGLPNPCWVRVNQQVMQVIGGTLTFQANQVKRHLLQLIGAWRGSWTITVESAEAAALRTDPRWQALRTATPQQIDDWLNANMTTLASARQVFKILLLAVKKLGI